MASPRKHDPDERVAIPLDPETALRGLLAVDPESEAAEPSPCPVTWEGKPCLHKAGHFGQHQYRV